MKMFLFISIFCKSSLLKLYCLWASLYFYHVSNMNASLTQNVIKVIISYATGTQLKRPSCCWLAGVITGNGSLCFGHETWATASDPHLGSFRICIDVFPGTSWISAVQEFSFQDFAEKHSCRLADISGCVDTIRSHITQRLACAEIVAVSGPLIPRADPQMRV